MHPIGLMGWKPITHGLKPVLRQALGRSRDHRRREAVDFPYRRIDARRNPDPVELRMLDPSYHDLVLRLEPSSKIAHFDAFDLDRADRARVIGM